LLLVFAEMVRRVPDGSGLEGFIALDLGRHVAATVPPLYPLAVFAAALGISLVRSRRRARGTARRPRRAGYRV
jgi:hypothetical protein